jgi:hypothetical protein
MVNGLVAKAQKVPEEGWIVQDFTPWPGNNTRDHPGMIQVSIYKIKLHLQNKTSVTQLSANMVDNSFAPFFLLKGICFANYSF